MSQEDYNALLNGAVDLATDLLAAHSEFAPFGLGMQGDDGEIFHLEPEDADDNVHPEAIIAALRAGLREAAKEGRFRAVAIVTDVTLEDDEGEAVTAAIHISLEHADSDPISCVVPYTIEEDQVELDDLVAEPGDTIVFAEHLEN